MPGIGEHQRGIVARDQRRRRNDLVVIAGEEVEKALADVVDAAHSDRAVPYRDRG